MQIMTENGRATKKHVYHNWCVVLRAMHYERAIIKKRHANFCRWQHHPAIMTKIQLDYTWLVHTSVLHCNVSILLSAFKINTCQLPVPKNTKKKRKVKKTRICERSIHPRVMAKWSVDEDSEQIWAHTTKSLTQTTGERPERFQTGLPHWANLERAITQGR